MRENKEYQLSKQISKYLKMKYPKVIFHFDYAGLNLSIAQRSMMKAIQGNTGFPDLFIAHGSGEMKGLFLELKKETPYKINGTLKSQSEKVYKIINGKKVCIGIFDHLKNQEEMHKRLMDRDYEVYFVWDFKQAIVIIDEYLKK